MMSTQLNTAWSTDDGTTKVRQLFHATFDTEPTVFASAPGRVNLIGEHTDYNNGLCLPIALPHRTFVALNPRNDSQVRLISDQGALWEGNLANIKPGMPNSWVNYAAGPAWALGIDHGFDAAFASCVPLGAGLSSSAAIECASAFALSETDKDRIVQACIQAENEVAQAPTGGMDQTVSVFGADGKAVFIDFDANTKTLIDATFNEDDLHILVLDTRAKHSLADGQYGNRRLECDQAANLLGLSSLREAQLDQIDSLPPLLQQRVRHVVSENNRVTQAVTALAERDYVKLGQLFYESHRSLRDDFNVSCPELDCVVDTALEYGALGARMTGGGFGGSAIALIDSANMAQAIEGIRETSIARGFPEPAFLIANASSGASRL
ncbi:galactokinase [Arcanobacterium phocae]|uniref:galactokinase n=1 Tax=Arcanobacterium phocae TaxID=131112 RepID=UPI00209D618A|nr:galactokinase [Arcanobacterium phocae]